MKPTETANSINKLWVFCSQIYMPSVLGLQEGRAHLLSDHSWLVGKIPALRLPAGQHPGHQTALDHTNQNHYWLHRPTIALKDT